METSEHRAPRVAIYCRHSTLSAKPQTFADQADECQKLATTLGGTVVGTYFDAAASGYELDRPELQRLLHDIPVKGIDVVVAASSDRIARDLEHFSTLQRMLRGKGAALHTIYDDVDFLQRVAGLT